ncbi:MAG: choice-of-anchor L domain-containing protein [Crocinitomicaceae bacterium]|nr:choice-of-anchor L domain-containing protein [Crocinitomicaceae bacterium]
MKKIIAIFIIIFPFISNGQLITNGGMSPTDLVQNVLLGSGVTVSNITFNGTPIAIGQFDGSATNLGLSSGVIMTTGTIQNTPEGPHGPNNSEGAGMDNNAPGFSLLSSLIGGVQTYNAAILQFDFVPFSDTVRFNYAFGSEEYLEYVQAGFNDVFGFFISGPGIAGQQNIARLANGQAVAIDNIHSAGTNINGTSFGPANSQFYVNNAGGATIQYDGFTKVLTAESEVQCGETYHLIIAIADAGDGVLDSGIFLEANSLSSKTPVDISHQLSQNLFNDEDIMAEGCVSTTVKIRRGNNDVGSSMTIPIQLSGTAIEGVDYSNIPNSITFPIGVQEVSFIINAFQDGITEGQESITITLPVLDPCGNPNPVSKTIYINDVEPVAVTISGEEVICPGDPVILTANPTGGAPPYTYLWNDGQDTQSITVSPLVTTTYSVSVTDDCLNETANANIEVIVPVHPALTLNQTPDITEICPYITAVLSANPTGGSGNFTYEWSSNFESNLGNTNSISVTPSTTTIYTVTVTDNCGNTITENIVYTITSPPLTLTMSPGVEICPGDSVEIGVTATGGFGQYFYLWPHSGETTSTVWVNPQNTQTYTVIVSDECQTFTVEGETEITVVRPTANFTVTSQTVFNDLPIQFQNLSEDAISYDWDFGDFNESTDVHPTNIYDDPGIYIITLIATDKKGCTDTIARPLEVEEEWYIYVPNTFTPDGDRHNNDFRASTVGIQYLSISIYNRWGEQVFFSSDRSFIWDGTYEGTYVNDGTYTYAIEFVTNSRRQKSLTGHVNVLR